MKKKIVNYILVSFKFSQALGESIGPIWIPQVMDFETNYGPSNLSQDIIEHGRHHFERTEQKIGAGAIIFTFQMEITKNRNINNFICRLFVWNVKMTAPAPTFCSALSK